MCLTKFFIYHHPLRSSVCNIRSRLIAIFYSVPLQYHTGADPYCIVKCDGQKADTPVIKNTLNPTFGTKVNFYISNPAASEVTVQVRRKETRNLLWERGGGECRLNLMVRCMCVIRRVKMVTPYDSRTMQEEL